MSKDFPAWLRDVVRRGPKYFQSSAEQDAESVVRAGGDSLPGLLALVTNVHVDMRSRRLACWLLSQLGDEQAVPALTRALSDRDVSVQLAAVRALASFGANHAIVPLSNAAETGSSVYVREAALAALGTLKDARAVNVLVRVMHNHNELPRLRCAALWNLSEQDDARVVPLLAAMLHDPAPEVRFRASQCLGNLAYLGMIGEESHRVRSALERMAASDTAVAPGLGRVCEAAAYGLNALLEVERFRDAEALLRQATGSTRVADLIHSARDLQASPASREAAVRALAFLDDRRAIRTLRAMIDDHRELPELRRAALAGVSRQPGVGNRALLIGLLESDPDIEIRRLAAVELTVRRDRESLRALLRAVADPGQPDVVREAAAEGLGAYWVDTGPALGILPESEAVDPLTAALADPSPKVRSWAAKALAGRRCF